MKQVEETEAVRKAEEAYKETLERETIASQEKEQKIIEHIIERKKIVEKAKGRLMDAEAREYERHMKRLEKKMPNWRPKKGTMHLMGMRASEVSLEAVAAKEVLLEAAKKAEASGVSGAVRGHRKTIKDVELFVAMEKISAGAPGLERLQREGMDELVSRIKVKKVRKPNWGGLKEKLANEKRNPELKSEMAKSMMRRTIATTAKIYKMKMAAEKARGRALVKKSMVHGTWEKGTSHLYWSGADCTVVPAPKTESVLTPSGGGAERWLGYGKMGEEDKGAPFYSGRPVIPIVWSKAPKPEPYVREQPQISSRENAPTSNVSRNASPTPSPSTPARPMTTGGIMRSRFAGKTTFTFTTAQPNHNELIPFSKDPHPLGIRYDFDFKKTLMRDRSVMSAQRRKRDRSRKRVSSRGRREEHVRDDGDSEVSGAGAAGAKRQQK